MSSWSKVKRALHIGLVELAPLGHACALMIWTSRQEAEPSLTLSIADEAEMWLYVSSAQ